MDKAGEDFFPNAGFAGDQDGNIRPRNHLRNLACSYHFRAGEGSLKKKIRGRAFHFAALLMFQRVFDSEPGLLRIEGIDQIITRTQLYGFDNEPDLGGRSDHDYRQRRVRFPHPRQERQARWARLRNVEESQKWRVSFTQPRHRPLVRKLEMVAET